MPNTQPSFPLIFPHSIVIYRYGMIHLPVFFFVFFFTIPEKYSCDN